uniref:Uncharacterized protein n=1 Tax=Glycine max TaxID=3847 RepID=A0A0R0G441_SOYBN
MEGRHYQNYDHIDKILRSLSRKWRPLVTTLRAIKNLDSMTLEELVKILKVHKQDLAQDNGIKKGKSLSKTKMQPCIQGVIVQSLCQKSERYGETRTPPGSTNHPKDPSTRKRKVQIYYKYKKLGHFMSKCPNLAKPKDKKKKFFKSKKRSLMSTWGDFDDSSSNEDSEEEANLCLIADASTSKAKSALDVSLDNEDSQPKDTFNSDGEEVIFESREDLIKGYNQLLFASACVTKAYRKLNKHFQHLEKEHEDLRKAHKVHLVDFVLETSLPSSEKDTCVCEEVKALLDEKVFSGRKTLLKDFQDMEERVKSLTTTFEDLVEGHKEMIKQKLTNARTSLKEVIVCYLYGKVGHETHKCKDLPEKGNPSKGSSSAYQHPYANQRKEPKKIWVPKSKIILVIDLLDSQKETPIMVFG